MAWLPGRPLGCLGWWICQHEQPIAWPPEGLQNWTADTEHSLASGVASGHTLGVRGVRIPVLHQFAAGVTEGNSCAVSAQRRA